MKKYIEWIVLAVAVAASLAFAIGAATRSIDDYTWKMSMMEITSGDRPSDFSEGPVLCTAENGVLTLTEPENGQTYTGTYRVSDKDMKTIEYEIMIGNTQGTALLTRGDALKGDP